MPVSHSSSLDRLLDYVPDLMEKTNNMMNRIVSNKKEETEKVDIDQPVLLKKMIDAHLYDLDYSEEELSNLVGLSVADFQNLCTMLNRKNYRLKILL